MKLKFKWKDKILKHQRWIEKIKENREVFIIVGMVIILNIIVCLSEVLDIPQYLLGAPKTPINWREALFLSILITSVGSIAIAVIRHFVSEHKQSKEIIQKSEAKYRTTFESTGTATIIIEEDMTISMINSQCEKVFGYSKEKVEGKKSWIEFVVKEDLERMKEYHRQRRINPGKAPGNYEFRLRDRYGKVKDIFLTIDMIPGTKQSVASLLDITERKQSEKLKEVLYNISRAANSKVSLNQLYPIIHQELGTIIDVTNFFIALADYKEDKLSFPYYKDEKDNNFPIQELKNSGTVTACIIETGQSLLINREQINEIVAQRKLKNVLTITDEIIWLGVPLKVEDRVIGAMVVQSYTNPKLYTEKDVKLMEFVSEQIATAIDRKQTEERIKHLSFHDSLTGLYNRAYFEEELERYNFPRYYPLSIVSIDINGLKVVNDTFGHNQGDRLLQHLASLLTSISRKGDILSRVGGDEFAILLPSTPSQAALDFCQRIRKVCEEDKTKPVYLRPNISLGQATQEGEYQDIDILLKEADNKMYQDKLFSAQSREKYLLDSFRIILAERDSHAEDHAQRLQKLALSLGKRIGLTEYQLNNLKLLALLHDIGKIGIPDNILFKTYDLTPSEWKKMKEHPKIGYRMAKNIPDFTPIAREILYHHENWDGTGYPEGLKGEKIPLLSRIISIVDAYDVMQSRRPYKGAVSKTKALKEIKRGTGTQFDPQLVEIFLKIV